MEAFLVEFYEQENGEKAQKYRADYLERYGE